VLETIVPILGQDGLPICCGRPCGGPGGAALTPRRLADQQVVSEKRHQIVTQQSVKVKGQRFGLPPDHGQERGVDLLEHLAGLLEQRLKACVGSVLLDLGKTFFNGPDNPGAQFPYLAAVLPAQGIVIALQRESQVFVHCLCQIKPAGSTCAVRACRVVRNGFGDPGHLFPGQFPLCHQHGFIDDVDHGQLGVANAG